MAVACLMNRESNPIAKPRERLLSLRMTDEEFQVLKAACIASGGRSLSDFARAELFAAKAASIDALTRALVTLERRLAMVENLCDLLVRELHPRQIPKAEPPAMPARISR